MSAQQVSALLDGDLARLREQRAIVEGCLDDDDWRKNDETPSGKLGTLRAVLDAGVFDRAQTYELQCLGIVLGDALVQELAMEWVMVTDEYGRDPAVRLPGTSILLFPLTMISKRVEKR